MSRGQAGRMEPAPICRACFRYSGQDTCEAFPDGIPGRIMYQHYDHRLPFPGDKGLRFELNPTAAEILHDYEAVDRLLRELTASA